MIEIQIGYVIVINLKKKMKESFLYWKDKI